MLLVVIVILVKVLVPDVIESRLIRRLPISLSLVRLFGGNRPLHCGFQFDIIVVVSFFLFLLYVVCCCVRHPAVLLYCCVVEKARRRCYY